MKTEVENYDLGLEEESSSPEAGQEQEADLETLYGRFAFPAKAPRPGTPAEKDLIESCLNYDDSMGKEAQLDNLAIKLYGGALTVFGWNSPERNERQEKILSFIDAVKEGQYKAAA